LYHETLHRKTPPGPRQSLAKGRPVHDSSLILVLLTAIVVVAVIAKRLALPYPIAFVIGGSLLAFVPYLPSFQLDPGLVFFIFLPPLLYSGGWQTDWQAFKANLRPIGLLAIGLVIFTTGVVGVVVHALVPQLGWSGAFVLGAIVSPPDAVAASTVFERFTVPRRLEASSTARGSSTRQRRWSFTASRSPPFSPERFRSVVRVSRSP